MPLPIDLWLIHPERDACEAFEVRFGDLPNVTILQKSYEELPKHDCFVTAANSFGLMTAGIDAAIIAKFGDDLMKRIQHRILDEFLGEQPVGTALIEATGDANFPYLVHAPTMRVPGSIVGKDNIYAATWAALGAVYRWNAGRDVDDRLQTVVFPAMGTGFGGVSYSESARQMAAAYRHYLHPPHRFDWEIVTQRHRAIAYDGSRQVVK